MQVNNKTLYIYKRLDNFKNMLTLHLIRHAKTEVSTESDSDKDRQLTQKGIEQAVRLGKHIEQEGVSLGLILCSTAQRTKETMFHLLANTNNDIPPKLLDSLYLASAKDILIEIDQIKKRATTLTVIGHNEGISELASVLADKYIQLHPCEMVTLTFDFEEWYMLIPGSGFVHFHANLE